MRIGVVTTSYPRFDGDAAGSFVAAHVAALRVDGHDVEVISAQSIVGGSGGARVGASLFDGAGAPDELERGSARMYLDAARFTAAMTAAVARRAHRWDLVIAHWLAPSALAALPSRTPLLAIAHGGDVHTLRRLRLLAPALHALRARGARLVFVTEELRSIARAASPRLAPYIDDALVQPMGIDVARFAALGRRDAVATESRATVSARPVERDAAHATGRRSSILVVARLVPVKGVDVALDAYRLLTTRADLVIAGDGPERAQLERLAGTTPSATIVPGAPTIVRVPTAAPAIRFLGAVDAATRDQLLCDTDLVVIPSRVLPDGRSEGSPMIALEALAAGVPVVASAVGGLCDLPGIAHVRPDDPPALAAAIDRVLAAPPAACVDVSHLDWRCVCARLLAHAAP
jgi:glycosyltransferase involved in cell wall biosynthesis